MKFWKFLGRIFPQNSALSSLVASLYDIRVTRQSSKILSAEKRFFSFSFRLCCFSTDQGGLLALADGPCADTSSTLADLVSVLC